LEEKGKITKIKNQTPIIAKSVSSKGEGRCRSNSSSSKVRISSAKRNVQESPVSFPPRYSLDEKKIREGIEAERKLEEMINIIRTKEA